ncbi:hypothetical protein CCACVL1_08583 [Corchorus capsularis]|uniref:Uncharacterized protein n=1 Tax=Corchorus capsularis TaxID=210143 RepID=A0A1R3IZK8_COCAP|nr:hypothetical protein CCACVL1_08583 [Corchorus capsularis]
MGRPLHVEVNIVGLLLMTWQVISPRKHMQCRFTLHVSIFGQQENISEVTLSGRFFKVTSIWILTLDDPRKSNPSKKNN